MSNHLKYTSSPYLLQHAENPVDWYPWCEEAFEKARKEDKPVFLSIGYSTCHWCHVMAHESFENRTTAEILNRYFISIKVDREERPDIDSVYMSVCQAFTGSGGWPVSIFMTWDKKPFLAGTYFPVQPKYGMPGFSDLLLAVERQWNSNRDDLLRSADQIIAHLKQPQVSGNSADQENFSERAVQLFLKSFDGVYGGFEEAPKFPIPHNLWFLTLYAKQNSRPDVLDMAEKTLTQMRKGGIFDHIGYGFSRYSTDRYFLVPHFEKMLYDNALLIIAYASVYSITQKQLYLDTAEKTAQYVLREMTSADGGFYSGQDADSEGKEGKYYTFALTEIMDVLGKERGKQFSEAFDITPGGNFEGVNIPNLLKSNDLDSDFADEVLKLYHYRKSRCKLHLDDKILVSWNAMMIAALSILYRVSGNEKYLSAAMHAQLFIEQNLSEGLKLYTSWRKGKRSEKGFLDDYAFYTAALTELYHSALNRDYLKKAEQFCMEAVKRFADDKNGGFYLSDSNHTEFFMNPKEFYDGAVPSGNSVMAYNFIRLYQLTENEDYKKLAKKQMDAISAHAQNYPAVYSMFLFAKLLYDNPPEHIVIALRDSSDLEQIRGRLPFLANVIAVSQDKEYPLVNGHTTFYVCRDHVCLAPTDVWQKSI
ncbi:MAG: thioredoxin domain-containing protein [Eubacterium sp.]|nr:thioredoxin domain-containing protein [Eubacterium sp.]